MSHRTIDKALDRAITKQATKPVVPGVDLVNLLDNSAWAGSAVPSTAPTGWVLIGSGSFDAVTEIEPGIFALTFTANALTRYVRPSTGSALVVKPGETYRVDVELSNMSGPISLNRLINVSSVDATTVLTPYIEDAQSPGFTTSVQPGTKSVGMVIYNGGTVDDTVEIRIGLGGGGSVTGSCTFSKPRLVPGSVRGEYLKT